MITLILAIAAAGGVLVATHAFADCAWGWSVAWGIVSFAAFQGVFGFLMQKRIRREMEAVQRILLAGQKKLQAKTQRWQFRPPGSMQAAQKEIFEETRLFVLQAIEATKALEKYRLWVPMIERQIATARLQLYWMIRDFRQVDALLPKVLLLDPTMVAMKMARMQMLGAKTEEIGKVYAKCVRRLRYNQNVLVAATWSWILVKRGEIDAAFKALTEALRKSDDATLKANHETLMNNRVAHFTNSGIGEQWYALLLEEPKMKMQRPRSVYR